MHVFDLFMMEFVVRLFTISELRRLWHNRPRRLGRRIRHNDSALDPGLEPENRHFGARVEPRDNGNQRRRGRRRKWNDETLVKNGLIF